MIRRLFWLSLGAVLGAAGYRRATALARSLALRPAAGTRPAAARSMSPLARARAAARFARDVREGMRLYMERQHRRRAHTLERQQALARPRAAGERGARPAPSAAAARAARAARLNHADPNHAEDGR